MNARTAFELTVGQDTYEVKFLFEGWTEKRKKTRVYFSGVESPIAEPVLEDFPHLAVELNANRPESAKFEQGHVLYTDRGDWPEIDKAWDRSNRSYVDATTHHVERVLRNLFHRADIAGWTNTLGKVRFSKNAGCSCACSPGWVLEETVFTSRHVVPTASAFITDMFITKK